MKQDKFIRTITTKPHSSSCPQCPVFVWLQMVREASANLSRIEISAYDSCVAVFSTARSLNMTPTCDIR